MIRTKTRLLLAAALPLCMALQACGGGGGGVNSTPFTPSPPPPPPVPPPPPPPPPGPTGFNTVEFVQSEGIASARAVAAYEEGATGEGITAAIIDSGIFRSSREFAGRISPASQDVASNRDISDVGGHGTAVAGVLAAARDDINIVGIAFDATILALRTDEPGSCSTTSPEDQCTHLNRDIARAVDIAVQNNARVINISLGGGAATSALRSAIGRAANAGVVVVISAGNDGEAEPDPLSQVALTPEANGHVIIAGSVDQDDTISDFSNRAGSGASVYLAALGNRVRSFDQNGQNFLFSGTSFAAPQVSGAVALLADAFPNLSGSEIVQILFNSARDAGASGDDGIYGQGILDLTEAFSPRGASSIAGSATPVSLTGNNVTLSAPMGDAVQTGTGAIILDGFDRAFAIDIAAAVQRTPAPRQLNAALANHGGGQFITPAGSNAILAFSIRNDRGQTQLSRLSLRRGEAERSRVAAGIVAGRLNRSTTAAFAFSHSGDSVGAQLSGRQRPAFLVARDAAGQTGFTASPETSFGVRRALGTGGVTVFGETGEALSREDQSQSFLNEQYRRTEYSVVGLSADQNWGPVRFDSIVSYIGEDQTVLGARLGNTLGSGTGGRSVFAEFGVRFASDNGWSIGGDARHGWTYTNSSSAIVNGGDIFSFAASADVSKTGVLSTNDQLSLRIAQPLRVYSGGLSLTLPTSYDYTTETPSFSDSFFNLAPSGRQIDAEIAYSRHIFGGLLTSHVFYRRDPGNFATLNDDMGAAVRFTLGF